MSIRKVLPTRKIFRYANGSKCAPAWNVYGLCWETKGQYAGMSLEATEDIALCCRSANSSE